MSDIISRNARKLFEDHLVSESTIREIEAEFEAADIPKGIPLTTSSGVRRSLTQEYYAGLQWDSGTDVKKFLAVADYFVARVDVYGGLQHLDATNSLARFIQAMQKCGFEWQDGHFILLSSDARLADTKALAHSLDLPHLGDHIRRIETSIDADPAVAIGSAKEMVETVCKTILTKRASASGVTYSKEDDLNELGKKAFGVLRQLPDDIPDRAKGAKTIKTMLSNLRSVVQCTAELRNWYGNGHGREGDIKRGLSPRHARLVVGAASTLSWYLLETDRDMG